MLHAARSSDAPPILEPLAPIASCGFQFQAMSSVCEIRLDAAPGQCEPALAAAAREAIDEVRRIELKYSRYRDDSIVSRINAAAGHDASIEVDAETAALLDFAGELHTWSDGLFDITSGVLRQAWNFRAARVPEPAALDALLPLIGWQQVEWSPTGAPARRIRLPRAGMELDFGGFGKEYAADRACAVLAAAGQRHGFVNLGGDIRVLGERADGSAWHFGIQHPRRTEGTIASVDMREGALASSGDYERFFEHDGRRYCHILDPRTGWPVSAWASVSVTAPACVAAGALSTIAMLKGEHALEFLATQQATFLAVDTALRTFHHGLPEADRFELGVSP
ncbi:MAG: FAD:protein FMN transferase [Burkholderiales bacterium]|nr:FAD:protein FMN transferase [Burkholderiales bacterium]